MPNELTIHPVSTVTPAGESHGDAKSEAFVPSAPQQAPSQAQAYLNPSLRLDAALGLVVIEFHDDSGALTSSIPSERQIEAYRRHQEVRPGQPRVGAKSQADPAEAPIPTAAPAPSATPSAGSDGSRALSAQAPKPVAAPMPDPPQPVAATNAAPAAAVQDSATSGG